MGYFSEEDIARTEQAEDKEYDSILEEKTVPATRTGRITQARFVNVRKGPRRDAEVLGQVLRDDEIAIVGESGDYYKVKYRNYLHAYIAKHLVEVE